MKPFEKHCPDCGAPVTFRKYLRTMSSRYICDACGVAFVGGGFWRTMVAGGLGSLFISMPLIEIRHHPERAWLAIPGLALSLAWGFAFFLPQRMRSKQAP